MDEQQEPKIEATPEQSPAITSQQLVEPKPPRNKKKIVIICAVMLALLGVGAAVYFLVIKRENQSQTTLPAPAAAQKQPEVSQEVVDKALQKFITPTTGEVWLPQPKKIAAQDFFKFQDFDTEYYEVGKRGDRTILMTVISAVGDDIQLYERAPDGTTVLIARPDGDATYNEDNEKYFSDTYKVTIDKTIHYDSLTIPAKIAVDKNYSTKKPTYTNLGDYIRPYTGENKPTETEVKKLGGSKLLKTETAYADTKLTSIAYYIQTPVNTKIYLGYEPLELDLKDYQWQTGVSTSDKIHAISRGCGGRASAITRGDTITDSDTQAVGKSPSGLQVAEFKDPNHPVVQKAFEEFKEFNATSPEVPYANISKTDFIREHAIVLHKDKSGQWLVYIREQLAPAYGCAKPVVYLYPTVTTNVNVRVGADVKLSDPLYNPATGWNAFARPDGQLSVNGQQYDSLFWEGPGHGSYPAITSGSIVPTSSALNVARIQLAQQGLNQREINDFIDYWQPKLPNKPFTRLSWLTTTDMNQLAPLYITPAPDTTIRVFLDFAGLDAPYPLPSQQLSSPARVGFTVVEWGGLSPTRLY